VAKITSARITIEPVWDTPIDGLAMFGREYSAFKELCDLFGYSPRVSERFKLHVSTSGANFHIENMDISQIRIVLDELSQRGLDLSEVGGMEARYEVEK